MNQEISIQTLDKCPENFDQCLSIIEEEFHYLKHEHFQFQHDFSPLMDEHNWKNLYLIFKDKILIGHIGTKPTLLSKENSRGVKKQLRVLFLGGIAITKSEQGKGYFKKAFQQILKNNISQYGLFFLWSNLNHPYAQFQFHEVGKIYQIGRKEFHLDPQWGFKKITPSSLSEDDQKHIKMIHDQFFRPIIFTLRSERDWKLFFQCPSIDLYVRYHDNIISEYFVINKGKDLPDIIHEFGSIEGDILHPPTAFQNILKQFKTWSPCEFLHVPTLEHFYLGQVKIGNIQLLEDFFEKLPLTPHNTLNEKEFLESLLALPNNQIYIPGFDSI